MSKLREQLLALFTLKKGKIQSANRKSLDRFIDRTEFQRRRQVFFETACSFGKKKSRVAMCKKGKRPGFAVELKTQSTKQLRQTISDFLKQLGILDVPKLMKKDNKQLESLARKHHWEAVLFLSNSIEKPAEEKGGMMKKEPRTPRQAHERIDLTSAEVQEHLADRRRKSRRRQSIHPKLRRTGSQPLRLREPAKVVKGPPRGSKKRRLQVGQITGRDATGALVLEPHEVQGGPGGYTVEPVDYDFSPRSEVNDPIATIPEVSERIAIRRPAVVERERSPPPLHEAEEKHFEGYVSPVIQRVSENPPRQRVAPPRLRTEQKLRTAVVPRKKTQTAVLPKVIPKITQLVKTGQDEPELPKDEKEEKSGAPELGNEDPSDERRECYAMSDDEDVCGCEPDPLTSIRLTRAQRKELNRINALRKLNCAKLNLLKCTLDLKQYQTRVWEADRLNTNGDYLALFGKNPSRKLNKIKNVTAPGDRDFLKAVLANQNATMRLKKGKEHLQRRLANTKGKLGKDYTLASMRHDQVLDEKAWSNDIFTIKALQNRDKEAPLAGKITCDTFKVPKCPPPLQCPEKKKEKPYKDLSQLPKVVPQKDEDVKPTDDTPREPPIETGSPSRREEPLRAREEPLRAREVGLPDVPELADPYPASRVHWAPTLSQAQSPIDPAATENIALLEQLVHTKQRELATRPPPSEAPTAVSLATTGVELGPAQLKAQAEEQGIQQHSDIAREIARRTSPSAAPDIPHSEAATPVLSHVSTGGDSPKSFHQKPPSGHYGGSGSPTVVRYSTAIAQPSTPVLTGKPGALRKVLDLEPLEFGPSVRIPVPEPGSPSTLVKSLTTPAYLLESHEKTLEAARKKPSIPVWRDVVKRVSPEKNPQLPEQRKNIRLESILPVQMPPLSLGTSEGGQPTLLLHLEDTILKLQFATDDYNQEFRTQLTSLRWPEPRSDLPKVPKILRMFPWRDVSSNKKVQQPIAQQLYNAIEPLLKQVDWIQISEPITENRVTAKEINLAKQAIAIIRVKPSSITVEMLLNLLQVIAPRKIEKKRKRMVDGIQLIYKTRRKKDVIEERLAAIEAEKHERSKKAPKVVPKTDKTGSGFRSRVGALLKKRRKRKKSGKKRKPRKPRAKKQKLPKVAVQKQEPVLQQKKQVEIPASPKISKTAGAIHKFPDFVRKRRTKKYLN